MKRAISLLLMCGMAISAGAQTMYDALKFSGYDYYGTARTIAMGNAFTALGGDLGSIGINPAGSAVAGYSQATLTPGISIVSNNAMGTSFSGEANGFEKHIRNSRARFEMPNLGFTINFDMHRNHGLKNVTLGAIMNMTGYFNDNMQARGSNRHTSFMGALASDTNGWNIDDLMMKDAYYDSPAPWSSILGWEAGLISTFGPFNDQYIGTSEQFEYIEKDDVYNIWQSGPLDQSYGRSEYGYRYDCLINLGFNFSDRLYIGVNWGITQMDYAYQDWFKEKAQDPSLFRIQFDSPEGDTGPVTYFSDMKYNSRYEASGVGFYGKFGFIVRPVKGLRIGGAIQTPTGTRIKEYWQSSAASYYMDSKFNAESSTPEGEYEYKLVSPFRFNVGLAYTIGTIGLISADYEMSDYSSMKFKETGNMDNSVFDEGVNLDIKDFMGVSNIFRAGIELRPLPAIAVRAGYGLTTSPEKYYDENELRKSVKSNKNSFAAGIGYNSRKSFFADFAFRATKYANEYVYPYSDYHNAHPSPEILNKKWMYDIVLTIGARF